MSRRADRGDALIIGSGVGGLSMGIILARLGFKVTVLEKNPAPGGVMRSYRRGGMDCSVGVHYLGALDRGQILRRFFDYLGVTDKIPLERMGRAGIVDRYIYDPDFLPSGVFDFPEGFDAYEENLIATFPQERAAIARVMATVREGAGRLDAMTFLYPSSRGFSVPEQMEQMEPFGRFLDRLNCSAQLRSVLGVPSSWVGVPVKECPVFYHTMTLASYLLSSWRLKNSGSSMAAAFVERLQELGGAIVSSRAVDRILVDSGAVQGVELRSGRRLKAPLVVAAVHPKEAIRMLPPEAMRPSYRKRIQGLQDTHGIFCVHAAVDNERIPHNILKITADEQGTIEDILFCQIRQSASTEKNLLSILTSGKDALWQSWEHTFTGHRGREYQQRKEAEARALIQEAAAVVGPFEGVELLDAFTPLTIRDWNNSPGGTAYGVLRSTSQRLSAAFLNRTKIRGLFLAGQSVLAPGVLGTIMGSFDTARHILGQERFNHAIPL